MNRNRTIIISTIILIPILVCLMLFLSRTSHQGDWRKKTTPLPKETRDTLCAHFELPSNNVLCSGHQDVYALDFVSIIEKAFRPYEAYRINRSEAATYDEVEKKIGEFKYECEPAETTGDGLTYFRCSYDLRGDRKFVMTFLFTYPEKTVMRIMSTSRVEDY